MYKVTQVQSQGQMTVQEPCVKRFYTTFSFYSLPDKRLPLLLKCPELLQVFITSGTGYSISGQLLLLIALQRKISLKPNKLSASYLWKINFLHVKILNILKSQLLMKINQTAIMTQYSMCKIQAFLEPMVSNSRLFILIFKISRKSRRPQCSSKSIYICIVLKVNSFVMRKSLFQISLSSLQIHCNHGVK